MSQERFARYLRDHAQPNRSGEVLREFLLPDAEDIELSIENDRSRRCRALVNGENVGTHGVEPPSSPPRQ
jgi:hypothetical protein